MEVLLKVPGRGGERWLNEQNQSGWARLTAPGSVREEVRAGAGLWDVRWGKGQVRGPESQI